ncbi:olfactory receptor 6F1-like [Alligator mississippiensis]|uniref:olfactory receptor 6F1-like n=1 Tax=Alligator mississippiensis TaxID=8496 RepID=UPI0003D0C3D8|nr:olfactory receptor 6F1-like [Alligator mississippiensis]
MSSWDIRNGSSVMEFIFVGFSVTGNSQLGLFFLFTAAYLFTILANITIIIVVVLNHQLHTPMYFFLSNLSFLDIWYVTVTVPRLLVDLLMGKKPISITACFTQFYFFFVCEATENFLLMLMGYDRYLAICQPLHYLTMMNTSACICLVTSCWTMGFLVVIVPMVLIANLSFCGPHELHHIFCDFSPLLRLSCTDTSSTEAIFYALAWAVLLGCCLFTMVSYVFIISTIVQISSDTGRSKMFSTCAGHLTVVLIYYGTSTFTYICPSARNSFAMDKAVSVFYTIVTPILNPIIYRLRNKDMKVALKKTLRNWNNSLGKGHVGKVSLS